MAGNRGVRLRQIQLFEQATQFDVQGPIDNDAQCAFCIVFTHERHSRGKIGIGHSRHGDQELIAERILEIHAAIMAYVAGDRVWQAVNWYGRWTVRRGD